MLHVAYHLGDTHAILTKEKPSSVCLVTTKKVALPCQLGFVSGQEASDPFPCLTEAKGPGRLEETPRRLLELDLDRRSIVVILGGSTVGDLPLLLRSICGVSGTSGGAYELVTHIYEPLTEAPRIRGIQGLQFGGFVNRSL